MSLASLLQDRDEPFLHLEAGRLKRVHVNQHRFRKVRKGEEELPCIAVKSGRQNEYGREVLLAPGSEIVQSIACPLSCGARLWLATRGALWIFPSPAPAPEAPLRLVVLRSEIRRNLRLGDNAPCVRVEGAGGSVRLERSLRLLGWGRVVQHPEGLWIETWGEVLPREAESPSQAKRSER